MESSVQKGLVERQRIVKVSYHWTETERDVLRKFFPDYQRMRKKLQHRSLNAIRLQCYKLGMKKKIHRYTGAELSRLRKMYPGASREQILEAFPDLSWSQIRQCAYDHGIRRKRYRYKETGDPAMDAFLSKICDVDLYLPAIDEKLRKKGYFERQNWRRDGVNYKKLGVALRKLGGQFEVKWREFDDRPDP